MPPAELARLAALARAGDVEARNAIVEANLPLAKYYARRLGGPPGAGPLGWDDLVQEMTVALMRAAETWDPAEAKFSTYAKHWCRHYFQEARRQALPLAMGARDRKAAARLLRLGDKSGLAGKRLEMARAAAAVLSAGSASPDAAAAVPAPEASESARAEMAEWVAAGLARLEPRQREWVERAYGFGGREPESRTAIGRSAGLSRQTAVWVIGGAIRRLAEVLGED